MGIKYNVGLFTSTSIIDDTRIIDEQTNIYTRIYSLVLVLGKYTSISSHTLIRDI